jgi:general secretion pathway protein E
VLLPTLENINLEPAIHPDIDHKLAIKNYLLFAKRENTNVAILHPEHIPEGLNQFSRFGLNMPIYVADIESYDNLKNKFKEIQTSNEFARVESTSEELIEAESDLLEFIQNAQDLLSDEASAPVIKLVNSLFFQSIKKGASDIHIESHENRGEVRIRIDGALKKHIDLDRKITTLVINRIKVISNLDISEKRVPQDGRTQVSISGKTLDIRVSILPTYHGERVVMRILMQSEHIPTLKDLGFDRDLTNGFYKLLNHSHGMLLVTGPTGSGKSTTLHAFMQHISSPDKNIITIEDPVEFNADDINQIQVNEKVGLTFAAGLRSILRQDPDVVMVGEIRDEETAQIAVQASLTGHLMLSTLHTNDATSALTRLMDMNVQHYLISSTLLGVLAQRLTRKLCSHCKEPTTLDREKAIEVRLNPEGIFYKAVGCKMCDFTGYSGRVAVGELFILDDQVRNMINKGMNDHEIRESLRKSRKFLTIADRLRILVMRGITSYEEALRIGLMDR